MIRIEPLAPANLHHLIELYRKVFGKKVDLPYLQKKMDGSRFGLAYLGHLALDENTPVAYYGAIPFAMEQAGKTEVSAQSGDAMTLPSYAGKGLFTQLGQATDEQLEKAGIRFVWGFPNQNSEYGYTRKLHWEHTHRLHAYHINVRSVPVAAAASKTGWTNQVYLRWMRSQLKPYLSVAKEMASSVAQHEWGGTVRDASFFQYKQFTPNFILELEGKKVWVSVRSGLWVGDLEAMPAATFQKVLAHLQQLAAQLGLKEVVLQFSPGTMFDKLLSQHYSPQSTWIAGFKNYSSSFDLGKLRFSFGDLDTF